MTSQMKLESVGLRCRFTSRTARHERCPRSRQNVAGRVFVAVQMQPALLALVLSFGQGLWGSVSATGAVLTCVPGVHGDHYPAGAFSLGGQDLQELPPAHVMHGLGQSRSSQPCHVQVLDRYRVVPIHQGARRLEVEISACSLDGTVALRDQANSPASVCSVPLALRDDPLGSLHGGFTDRQMAGVRDMLPIAGGEERREPYVQADALAGRGQRTRRHVVAGEGDEPVSATISPQRDRFDPPLNLSVQEKLQSAYTAETQTVSLQLPTVLPKGHAVVAIAGAESRMAGHLTCLYPAKEGIKGTVQSSQGPFDHLSVNSGKLGALFLDFRELLGLRVKPETLPLELPMVPPFLERGVVQFTQKPKLPLGFSDSRRGEPCLIAVGADHDER